jgi:hypothetical protein
MEGGRPAEEKTEQTTTSQTQSWNDALSGLFGVREAGRTDKGFAVTMHTAAWPEYSGSGRSIVLWSTTGGLARNSADQSPVSTAATPAASPLRGAASSSAVNHPSDERSAENLHATFWGTVPASRWRQPTDVPTATEVSQRSGQLRRAMLSS